MLANGWPYRFNKENNMIRATLAAVIFSMAGAALAGDQGVTPTEILIGGFGPITGPLSWLGQGSRDGTQLAVLSGRPPPEKLTRHRPYR